MWLDARFVFVIGFTEHLQNITTNSLNRITQLHTPKITLPTAKVTSSQTLVAVAWFSFLCFPNYSHPLPPASHVRNLVLWTVSSDSSEILVVMLTPLHEPHRKRIFHYCVILVCRDIARPKRSFVACIIICLHSCYSATGLHEDSLHICDSESFGVHCNG
jgi:hypothetical protein